MNKLCYLGAIALLFTACQAPPPPQEEGPARYTTNAPEIDAARAGMDAYLAGDWDTFRSGFADDAEIYHNSTEASSVDAAIEDLQEGLKAVSSYSMAEEQYWERIIDDDGETWVYFWGIWNAQHATSDTQFEVPVHVAWQYEEGKVIEEYGLWDNSQVMMAEMESGSE